MTQILIRNITKIIDYSVLMYQLQSVDYKLQFPKYQLDSINEDTSILICFDFETNTGKAAFVDSVDGIVIHAEFNFEHYWCSNTTTLKGIPTRGSSGTSIIKCIEDTYKRLQTAKYTEQLITPKTDSYDVF